MSTTAFEAPLPSFSSISGSRISQVVSGSFLPAQNSSLNLRVQHFAMVALFLFRNAKFACQVIFSKTQVFNSLVQQCKLHRFNHMTDPSLITWFTWCQIHHHRGHVIWLWSFRWPLSHVRVGARDRSIRAWNKLSDMDW